MARIPFDIKYRPQIESGEYKVFAREHEEQEAHIIYWDNKGGYPIIALVDDGPEKYDKFGRVPGGNRDSEYSLFIVTPEEELSEFENRLCEILDYAINHHIHSTPEKTIEDTKKLAPELLSLAREQLIKDGYVIEKKAFHDTVENISDKHQAEMSVEYSIHCKVKDGTRHAVMNWDEFQKVAQKFIDIGKAEALKDLPRWKRFRRNSQDYPFFSNYEDGENCLVFDGKCIKMCVLMKLPGFKEDEK